MSKQLLLSFAALCGGGLFAAPAISTVTCRPTDIGQPIYSFTVTSAALPPNPNDPNPPKPVSTLTVSRTVDRQTVSATIDLNKYGANTGKVENGIGPTTFGSTFVYVRTFGVVQPNQTVVTNGYLHVYTRGRTGTSVVDVQLPEGTPNAALVNTTPPLVSFYSCK